MKRQSTPRLETRTKESNMRVSIMVENQICMRNESKGRLLESLVVRSASPRVARCIIGPPGFFRKVGARTCMLGPERW